MEYQMEELLPLVTALTEKFTSKESSSVTYETAQMLMEAVLFCIQEYEEESGESLLAKKGCWGLRKLTGWAMRGLFTKSFLPERSMTRS